MRVIIVAGNVSTVPILTFWHKLIAQISDKILPIYAPLKSPAGLTVLK